MNELDYIINKFNILLKKPPIEILEVNRAIMAKTIYELGYKVGVEIGVAQGKHSELLLQSNPNLKLFSVDIWERYEGYKEYANRIDKYYLEAQERLKPFGNRSLLRKDYSMNVVKNFEDFSLDFVYIDGAHDLMSAVCDIVSWSKKVRVGGMVYGHDYERRFDSPRSIVHVRDAVDAYMYDYGINPWFILGMGGNHSDGLYREGVRSWMYIRQEKDRYFNG